MADMNDVITKNDIKTLILYQCRLVKKIPITLITPYPALPPLGEGFGMGVWKYKFSQKLLTKRY